MRAHFNQQLQQYEQNERHKFDEKLTSLQKAYNELKFTHKKTLDNELGGLRLKLSESQQYASQLQAQLQLIKSNRSSLSSSSSGGSSSSTSGSGAANSPNSTSTVSSASGVSSSSSSSSGGGSNITNNTNASNTNPANTNPPAAVVADLLKDLNNNNTTTSMTQTELINYLKRLKHENNELKIQVDSERRRFSVEKEKWYMQFQSCMQNKRNSVNISTDNLSNLLYSSCNSASNHQQQQQSLNHHSKQGSVVTINSNTSNSTNNTSNGKFVNNNNKKQPFIKNVLYNQQHFL